MKIRKQTVWYGIVIVAVFVGLILFVRPMQGGPTKNMCIGEACFILDVADTPDERILGLMYRTALPSDHGMLFVFPNQDIHDFWMKNTLIPLDIIRINAKYQIVDIQKASPCIQDPCTIYHPRAPSLYVIELAGGITEKIGLTSGEYVSIQ